MNDDASLSFNGEKINLKPIITSRCMHLNVIPFISLLNLGTSRVRIDGEVGGLTLQIPCSFHCDTPNP